MEKEKFPRRLDSCFWRMVALSGKNLYNSQEMYTPAFWRLCLTTKQKVLILVASILSYRAQICSALFASCILNPHLANSIALSFLYWIILLGNRTMQILSYCIRELNLNLLLLTTLENFIGDRYQETMLRQIIEILVSFAIIIHSTPPLKEN